MEWMLLVVYASLINVEFTLARSVGGSSPACPCEARIQWAQKLKKRPNKPVLWYREIKQSQHHLTSRSDLRNGPIIRNKIYNQSMLSLCFAIIANHFVTLSAYNALAKLIRCFCPPLRLIPRSPICKKTIYCSLISIVCYFWNVDSLTNNSITFHLCLVAVW